ncbi:hypothetical protein M422DRAFT_245033 [Sphaerobolus stellatus SS14]|nr:hypothetical protein M422DRAFT_245033 [Sphaerobolus stellatus SS14]
MPLPRLSGQQTIHIFKGLRPRHLHRTNVVPLTRLFSFKSSKAAQRFASAVATARAQVPRQIPEQSGQLSYTPNPLPTNPPSSHARLKGKQELEATRAEQETAAENVALLPQANFNEKRVAVGWNTHLWARYHNIWLRDHCRCSECFHPITKQRLVDTFEIPESIQPSQVSSTEAGLEIIWPGPRPHKSVYPWSWLKRNSYDPPIVEKDIDPPAPTAEPHEKVFWGSRIQQDPPTVQFEEVMSTDLGLYKWLDKIDRFGFCFVTGVPVTPEETEKLSRRIGNIRETQYGGFWDFTADLKHGDTAYTNIALKAHTDTTYFTDPCGLQLFHLLSHTQGSGGQTVLVDGFYVASLLSTLDPEVYATLSNVPIPAHSAGSSADSPNTLQYLYHPKPKVGYPILNHDKITRELIKVRYNNDDRSIMNHLAPGMVEKWYNALRKWNKALSSPDSEYWVQLSPGTVVAIDNQRVLHGRSAFTGERRMCGAYIGMDDFVSKLNVLRAQYEPSEASKEAGPESVWDPAY